MACVGYPGKVFEPCRQTSAFPSGRAGPVGPAPAATRVQFSYARASAGFLQQQCKGLRTMPACPVRTLLTSCVTEARH